ncbi:MAG: hypothetical protein NT165_00170 [Candidatus Falkowbacteria bacterium]|nr:hypothetical protein [Candidatus Falkowbacteria bacterium]
MEQKRAKLIICHRKGNARILKEIEGSGERYAKTDNESEKRVIITQASTALIKEELLKIGLKIDDIPTIEKVAKKFDLDLVKIPGGKLALDEGFGLGLCEIISENQPEE